MESHACPNCGEVMAPHRHDQQRAQEKRVSLFWLICPSCKHVALASWHMVETLVYNR
jgi:ribosomal protein L32